MMDKDPTRDVIGLTLEDARKVYTLGPIRVIMRNGERLIGTTNYVRNRLNVSTVHGRIAEVLSVG